MEITRNQYEQIENCLPRQRGNVSLSNQQVLNAILYVAEHGCPWRRLPERFGNWHTIYTRMNRWSRQGVLDQVFARLQQSQIVRIRIEPVAPDGTVFEIHPVPKPPPRKHGPQSPCKSRVGPTGRIRLVAAGSRTAMTLTPSMGRPRPLRRALEEIDALCSDAPD